jgi:hypothetical protein
MTGGSKRMDYERQRTHEQAMKERALQEGERERVTASHLDSELQAVQAKMAKLRTQPAAAIFLTELEGLA